MTEKDNINANLKSLITANKYISYKIPVKSRTKTKTLINELIPTDSNQYSFLGKTNMTFYKTQKKSNLNHVIVLPNLVNEIDRFDQMDYDLNSNYEKNKELKDVLKLGLWENTYFKKVTTQNPKIARKRGVWEHSRGSLYNEVTELEKNSLNSKSQLNDIYKKNSEEQTTIFLQNINISMKHFKFDVFNQNNSEPNLKTDTFNSNMSENPFLKLKDEKLKRELRQIGINLEGNIESLMNVDYYRTVVKRKIKLETKFRHDLLETSHRIFEIKFEKKRLMSINGDFSSDINNLKDQILDENMRFNHEMKIIEELMKTQSNPKLDESRNKQRYYREENEEETLQYKRDLIIRKTYLQEEHDERIAEFQSDIENLSKIYNENKILIKDNERILKNYKEDYIQLTKEQTNYYLDLLHKGVDVRNEGLSWIVKRLIELGITIENSMFPSFLETIHIEYIIKISNLQIEDSQLKSILKILKSKQKKRREEDKKEGALIIKSTKTNFNQTQNNFTPKDTMTNFNQSKFSVETMQTFEKIFQKYDFMVKKNYEQQIEEHQINEMIEELKTKMKAYPLDESVFDNLSEAYQTNALIDNKNNQQYFQEIIMMRTKIKELERTIFELKHNEIKFYKRKFEAVKNGKFNMRLDLIYAALFGNNIVI